MCGFKCWSKLCTCYNKIDMLWLGQGISACYHHKCLCLLSMRSAQLARLWNDPLSRHVCPLTWYLVLSENHHATRAWDECCNHLVLIGSMCNALTSGAHPTECCQQHVGFWIHWIFRGAQQASEILEDCTYFVPVAIIFWVLVNIMTESSCCSQKCNRNSECRCGILVYPDFGQTILYTYLQPPSGADEVSGWSWQSLLFVMKGGDGPLLCGQPSQGCYDHTHCYYLLIVVVISLQFHVC